MGKDKKGRELQQMYLAKKGLTLFCDICHGNRGARDWPADSRHDDRHGEFSAVSDMTVNEWFEFWIENIVCDLAPNTRRNYRERYVQNIQPVIGKMKIVDVKPFHYKAVLNRMNADYAGSTIRQACIVMGTIFKSLL